MHVQQSAPLTVTDPHCGKRYADRLYQRAVTDPTRRTRKSDHKHCMSPARRHLCMRCKYQEVPSDRCRSSQAGAGQRRPRQHRTFSGQQQDAPYPLRIDQTPSGIQDLRFFPSVTRPDQVQQDDRYGSNRPRPNRSDKELRGMAGRSLFFYTGSVLQDGARFA